MTSTNDSVKTIDTIFGSIKKFTKTEFDEVRTIITSGCGAVCLDYDISGAKYVLPIAEWNIQPENISAAGIRAIPPPLVPGIPAGPPPVAPIGPLVAADINIANMLLNYYNMAKNAEKEANEKFTTHNAIISYIRTSLLTIAFNLDPTAYGILIKDSITNQPDRIGISIWQVLINFWNHYGIPDAAALAEWRAVFDSPRCVDELFATFIGKWSRAKGRLDAANHGETDDTLKRKFILATEHDPRVRIFILGLHRLYPGGGGERIYGISYSS